MSDDSDTYITVLKAAYDYEPQPGADDELAIKENQILFLVERVDDELAATSPALSYTLHLTFNRSPQLVEGQAETRRRSSCGSGPCRIR